MSADDGVPEVVASSHQPKALAIETTSIEMTSYDGVGHLNLTMHLGEGEDDDVKAEYAISLNASTLSAWVTRKSDGKRITVEVPFRTLLQAMTDFAERQFEE